MFDHVAIRVSDLEASHRFYELGLSTLGFGEPTVGGDFVEWNDLSISGAREDRPLTRRVHIGCAAPSREHVDLFWRTLTEQGFRDDGPPGPRDRYRPGYYGGFVLDPDGNSFEAVHKDNVRTDGWCIDHVWLRVRDPGASKRFYETIAPVLGFRLVNEGAAWGHFRGTGASFTVTLPGARPGDRGGVPPRRARRRLPRPRGARRAAGVPRRLLRRVCPRPGRQQRRGGVPRPSLNSELRHASSSPSVCSLSKPCCSGVCTRLSSDGGPVHS